MTEPICFGVLGGDRRQVYLAESLVRNGYEVNTYGFEKTAFHSDVKKSSLDEISDQCSIVILPLPVTLDGTTLKADYAALPIPLNDDFAEKMRGKRVFGGMTSRLYPTSEIWKEINVEDYGAREEFAIRNAGPTAEGAAAIAMNEYPGTIGGSRCLIAGFGRVGKALAHLLRGMGAHVFVAARKPADLAWIQTLGYHPVPMEELGGSDSYDMIFNTVPAMLFTRHILSELRGCALLVDLASAPGGVDFEAAEKIGIKALLAPSLPGVVAPKTAGEIIRETVCRMIGEQ